MLMAVCLLVTQLPLSVSADGPGTDYLYFESVEEAVSGNSVTGNKVCTAVESSESNVTWGTDSEESWYKVEGNIRLERFVTVKGSVNLILCDKSQLTAECGIVVEDGSSFSIYAQSTGEQMGKLTSSGVGNAGIGGQSKATGNITINGGYVTATGSADSAGIGGHSSKAVGNIIVNGGIVSATGGSDGAGIGGGYKGAGGNITINGGTITATGGNRGAGIGGGGSGTAGNITINGGTVTANNGSSSATCIGCGSNSDGGNIKLLGGRITAHSSGEYAVGATKPSPSSTTITLGWTKADDLIDVTDNGYSSSEGYYGDVTAVKDLIILKSNAVSGVLEIGELQDNSLIRKKKLIPADGFLLRTEDSIGANAEKRLGKTAYYLFNAGETVNLTTEPGYHFTQGGSISVTTESGDEVDVDDHSFVMPDEKVRVSGDTEENSYKVIFDGNAANVSGTMEDQSFSYKEWKALSAVKYSLDGKAFVKWNTKADGTGDSYDNREEVGQLVTEENGSLTLYAQWRDANAWDELQAAIDATEENGTLKLTKDYTAEACNEDLMVYGKLTLDLNGHVVDRNLIGNSGIIIVDGGELLITDSAPEAVHENLSYNDPISNEAVAIKGGALVRGVDGIIIKSGKVALDGGTVALNEESGVRVGYNSSTDPDFIMNGGKICGNGYYGIYAIYGKVRIRAGEIRGNQSIGLYASADCEMSGGSICRNVGSSSYPGGVNISSAGGFKMRGGSISDNYSQGYCAGVYVQTDNGTFEMSGGEIIDNIAEKRPDNSGAGIYVSSGTFAVSGKVTISGNTAAGMPSDVFIQGYDSYYRCVIKVNGILDPSSRIGVAGSYNGGVNSDGSLKAANYLPEPVTANLENGGSAAAEVFFLDAPAAEQLELTQYRGELVFTKKGCVHTVNFDSAGGSSVRARAVPAEGEGIGINKEGSFTTDLAVITEPAAPVKENYSFAGWYLGDQLYDFYTPVTEDITLTARWVKDPASAAVIKKGPQDTELEYGNAEGLKLYVEADEIEGHVLSFQWYENSVKSNTGGTAVEGAVTDSYTIPADIAKGATKYYYCVITSTRSDNGATAVTASEAAAVTVKADKADDKPVEDEDADSNDDGGKENDSNDDNKPDEILPEIGDKPYAIKVMEGAVAKNAKNETVYTAKENEVISISWTEKEGYEFAGWELTGATAKEPVSANTVFTMGAADVTVSYKTRLKAAAEVLEELPKEAENDKAVKIGKLSFESSKLTLLKSGGCIKNQAGTKDKTELPKVYYVTDNSDIVAVDKEGNFYPMGIGETTVTAYCGNRKAVCKVSVVSYTKALIIRDESGAEINGQTLKLKSGEQSFLTASFEPYDSTDPRKISWKSDNKKVGVKNGIITAGEVKEAVTANITASIKITDPETKKLKVLTAEFKAELTPAAVPENSKGDATHTLSVKKSLKLKSGEKNETAELKLTLKAKGSADVNSFTYSVESSNSEVVSVNAATVLKADGKKAEAAVTLEARSAGTAYIIVKSSSDGGKSVNVRRCKVTVSTPATAVVVKSGTLSVNDNKMTLRKGTKGTIETGLAPAYSTDAGKLKISGKGGITVKDGVIKATKQTKEGKTAKLIVSCGKLKTVIEVTISR